MHITIINILLIVYIFILPLLLSLLLLLSLQLLLLLLPLVLLSYSLNTHGGHVKSDNFLLQLLCHMTSDVKFLAHVFLLGLFNKYYSVLRSILFKKRSFDWNETMGKYIQISVFTGKRLWWRPFKYSCCYEGLKLYQKSFITDAFLWNLWVFTEHNF